MQIYELFRIYKKFSQNSGVHQMKLRGDQAKKWQSLFLPPSRTSWRGRGSMPRPRQVRSAEPSRGVARWRVTPLWARDKFFTLTKYALTPTIWTATRKTHSRRNFHLRDKQPSQPQRYARIAHHHFFARALAVAARCRRRQTPTAPPHDRAVSPLGRPQGGNGKPKRVREGEESEIARCLEVL